MRSAKSNRTPTATLFIDPNPPSFSEKKGGNTTTDGNPTHLRQQIRINLWEHLPHITRPWNNLPPRWRVLNTETNIRWNVGTVFGIKVFAYLAFLYDVAVMVVIIKEDANRDRRSPEDVASSSAIIPSTIFSTASRYCRRLAISMRSLPNDDWY